MGAGDGRFVLEAAQRSPDIFHIAIDAAASQMAESAGKAVRRRLDNVLFVQASVERLPPELAGLADRTTVNFPWGSLLTAVATPDPAILSAIAGLGRAGAGLTMLINMSVFDDAAYCAKLGFPSPPIFADADGTRAAFRQAGLQVTRFSPDVADVPYRTTWGQRLTKGAQRRVLQLDAVITGQR
nr:class I SAM-dependent methyltransferase [Inquilinus limosus]